MAYIRDYTVTEVTTASTNPAAQVLFPTHKTNDYIFLMLACDGTNVPSLPSGYTDVQNQAGTAQTYRLCYKKVTGADDSEVCPTLTLSAGDEWHIGTFAIAGADGSNPVDVTAERTATDATSPFTWTSSASTTTSNCLIMQFINSDTGLSLTCLTMGYVNLINGDSGTAGFGCAYGFQPASGAILDASWDGNTNDDTTACLVAIKDDGNGTRPGYADPTTSGQVITALGGTSLINSDTNPASLTFGSVGMKDFTKFWSFDGTSTYTDDTTDINDVGTADVAITNSVGAILYFGYDYKFNHMLILPSTASTGGASVWEYWNGSTWTTVTMSGSYAATAWQRFTWTMPTDWATTAVNSTTLYWIRQRITTIYTTAPVFTRGSIGGWLTTFDAAANAADGGVNPYRDALSLTPTATSNFSGAERQFGTAKDMDTGVFVLHHRAQLPRDYAVDAAISDVTYPVTQIGKNGSSGTISGYAGLLVMLADADSEYEAYSVHSKFSKSNSNNDYNVAGIALNNGAMPYATNLTLNKSSVTRMLFLPQGANGAMLAYLSALLMVDKIVFAGGDSTNPLNMEDFRDIANNCIGTSLLFNGVGDFYRIYAPLQIGGGGAIKTFVDGGIFQFPTKYDGKSYTDWNAADNVAGIQFYGTGSSDQLKFPNCVFKGAQPFRWEFNSSHSASAVLDFTGATVQGATVTLRSTVTLASMTFISCPTFTQNNAAISGSSFTGTKVTSDNPADLSDNSFTQSGSGHAIDMTTAGTYTFSGNTFSGYGPARRTFNTGSGVDAGTDVVTVDAVHSYANGDPVYYQKHAGTAAMGLTNSTLYYVRAVSTTTLAFYTSAANAIADTSRIALTSTGTETHSIYSANAAIYNSSAGSITLNISGGGGTPSIRNAEAASTTLNNNVTITINNLVAGSRVYIENTTDTVVLFNEIEATTTFSDTYNYTANKDILVRVRNASGSTKYKTWETTGTITTTGFTATANQITD